ncbi:TPA: hypothetical protein I8275_003811 [Citrobacter freundii]|uniref:hypothetical protein n=1 Tax=Citrobacter freundii TaxID=546 RepID=UPI0013C344FF|nr:hypothetical protein [Citrobacter freundii]HAT2622105.1 hypothetical protein [Citrobacter freundii]HAT4385107.1 hypothetical protein [Citrobacter freundii]HAT4409636.1 hypothetical protein [Citrobacter freundii]HCA7170788.1 hypothetical protein [Citrobacter freundii]HCA7954322.1 hypothetical protein [Citrobacter freundii]
MRGIIPLIICVVLAGCGMSPALTPMLEPTQCAAEKPTIDIVHLDGYFVISDDDMGRLTGYIAALESGCVAPK